MLTGERSDLLAVLVLLLRQVRDKLTHVPGRDLGELEVVAEEGEHPPLQVAAIVLPRRLAEPVAAVTRVGLDPLLGVLAEGEPRALVQLAAVGVGAPARLEALRLGERARRLPLLLAVEPVREDIAPTALVDAREAGPLHAGGHQTASL